MEQREADLVGKTIFGDLVVRENKGYFIKWNKWRHDRVYMTADRVERVLGKKPTAGSRVTCTISGLGPKHVPWNRQNPYAPTLKLATDEPKEETPVNKKVCAKRFEWKKTGSSSSLTSTQSSRFPSRTTSPKSLTGRSQSPPPSPAAPHTSPRCSPQEKSAAPSPRTPVARRARSYDHFKGNKNQRTSPKGAARFAFARQENRASKSRAKSM